MLITTIGHRGGSIQTSIPRQILSALGVHAGAQIYWTWNTKGHAEVRRLLQPDEFHALTPTPKTPKQPHQRRHET